MNSQVSFVSGHFSLIHIPLPLYPYLLQSILRILLPHDEAIPDYSSNSDSSEAEFSNLSIDSQHGFLNISITPLECSIVCPVEYANRIFFPAIRALHEDLRDQVNILPDPFLVFSVTSAGMEAGQRVLDLTSPLAMAGIPIFFITTYYTDFILVPLKSQSTVIAALLDRGFEFDGDSHDGGRRFSTTSSSSYNHKRGKSGSVSLEASPLSTPPPASVAELQIKTIRTLKAKGVRPKIEEGLELVQVSGHSKTDSSDYAQRPSSHSSEGGGSDWMTDLDVRLYLSLITALSSSPRFLSLTLSTEDAPSLLMDRHLLKLFGKSVVGDMEAVLIPIFLDLGELPTESTGIVCGVAGMVVAESKRSGDESGEMSYLSTARAGTLVIAEEGRRMALRGMEGLDGEKT